MRGIITLVFDDGYQAVYDKVVPLLNSFDMVGVFAMPLSQAKLMNETGNKFVGWEKWMTFKSWGHEIAAHSINHTDLTTITGSELDLELRRPQQILGANTIVYPGGAVNDLVAGEATKYYSAGRTVKKGIESIPPHDPMRLKTFDFTRNNFNIWHANALAAWAWITGGWLIETYHLVSEQQSEIEHFIKLESFTRHLKFINNLGIKTKTIQQVVKI